MNIGIAGAGLIGRLLAWQLLRRGHSVTLFDRDCAAGELSAARVAAAMLAPYSEVVHGERAIFDWGRESLALWPTLLQDLKTDSGMEVFFQQRGSIVVAHTPDRSNLDHFNQRLLHAAPDFRDCIKSLDQHALRELEPELAEHFSSATWLSEEGTLDNRELLIALEQAIRQRGAIWHEHSEVVRVDSAAIHLEREVFHCDLAIDARGFGAKQQFTDLRGVRGEVLWVHAPEVHFTRPVRLMHPRYQLYIAPKRNSVYVIGATEIESESLAPITVRSSLELQSALYSIHTGFAEANVLHAYANCRPGFMDNLPRVEISDGLLRVNGLYRHGYLLSPIVMQLALGALDGVCDHPMVRVLGNASQNLMAVNQ
jgi:glycine oxidase